MPDTLATQAQMSPSTVAGAVRLSTAHPGDRGVIVDVRAESQVGDQGVDNEELLRRLLEFGFVEGAMIEVLHEGLFGHDPIAVRGAPQQPTSRTAQQAGTPSRAPIRGAVR